MDSVSASRVTPLRDPDVGAIPQPPSNTEAEQALLGAILINNAAYNRVSEFLLAEDFAHAVHGRIYAALGKLIERGEIANAVTLKNLFDQDGALAEIGGAQYLARLAETAVTIINAPHYGRTIHDLHIRRELITIGQDVVADAFRYHLDDSSTEQIERAEAKLFELATVGQAEGGLRPLDLGDAIRRADAVHKGERAGLAIGFIDLDLKLGGLRAGNLVILAGRPSMGKTSLATEIALNAEAADAPTAIFSLEMSREELADRVLAGQSRIPSERIRRRGLDNSAFDAFIETERRLTKLPHVDDTPLLPLAALRTRARRLKRQHGLGLIIVDHIQLLRPSARNRPFENRVQELSDITRGLKAIAKELDVPVLALSQLSRAVEQREDKRPMLADLRESGSIEQDADIVMFLYRDDYYAEREEPHRREKETTEKFNERMLQWGERCKRERNVAEVIIAKNRNGPIGIARLFFDPALTHFTNLDRNPPG